jgi:hypothetical protein
MGRSEVLDALNAKGYLRKMAGITTALGDASESHCREGRNLTEIASGNGWSNPSALI